MSLLVSKSYSLDPHPQRRPTDQEGPDALGATDHFCFRLEPSFSTRIQILNMQTPTQKDMSKKKWKEK